MSLSKNAKSRIVTVTAPLFLGFVMPWFLQANRGIRGEAQFKLDPSAMLGSTVAEVLAAIAFVVVFIASLLYFAKQSDARKLLLLAGVVSLIAFIAFTLYTWQRIRLDLLRSFPNVSWFNSCGRIHHGCNSRSTDKTFQQELASLFRHLSVFMRNRDIKHYLNFIRFGVQMGGYFLD